MSLANKLANRYVQKQGEYSKLADSVTSEIDAIEGRGPTAGQGVSDLLSNVGSSLASASGNPLFTTLGGAALGAGAGFLGNSRRSGEGSRLVDSLMGAAGGAALGFGLPHAIKAIKQFSNPAASSISPEDEQRLIDATKEISPDRSALQAIGDNLGPAARWVYDPANPVTSTLGLGAAAYGGGLGVQAIRNANVYKNLPVNERVKRVLGQMSDDDLINWTKSLAENAKDGKTEGDAILRGIAGGVDRTKDTSWLRRQLSNPTSARSSPSSDWLPEVTRSREVPVQTQTVDNLGNIVIQNSRKSIDEKVLPTATDVARVLNRRVFRRDKGITRASGWKGFIEGLNPSLNMHPEASILGGLVGRAGAGNAATGLGRALRRPFPKLGPRGVGSLLGLLALSGPLEQAFWGGRGALTGSSGGGQIPQSTSKIMQERINEIMRGK